METVIQNISFYLGLDSKLIEHLISAKNKYYKKIIINKNGKKRTVFEPSSIIKTIQHFIGEYYLSQLNISKYATAYRVGMSLTENIKPHIKGKSFLLVDIKDFFDSINVNKFKIILKNKFPNLSDKDVQDITNICTYNDRFPQGAVTSPTISNIYMYQFDKELGEYVKKNVKNGAYTRYSDDITISSTERIEKNLKIEIENMLQKYDLFLNKKKTRFSSYLEHTYITGIKIIRTKEGNKSHDRISISGKKKKELKNMIYHKLNKKLNSREEVNQILGHLAYLKNIDIHYYNWLNIKYEKNNKSLITRLKEIDAKNNLDIT